MSVTSRKFGVSREGRDVVEYTIANSKGMIAKVLNEVMWEGQQTIILLETMSGKGSEIG